MFIGIGVTPFQSRLKGVGSLLFSDLFTGDALDTSKWLLTTDVNGITFSVASGFSHIVAAHTDVSIQQAINNKITTVESFSDDLLVLTFRWKWTDPNTINAQYEPGFEMDDDNKIYFGNDATGQTKFVRVKAGGVMEVAITGIDTDLDLYGKLVWDRANNLISFYEWNGSIWIGVKINIDTSGFSFVATDPKIVWSVGGESNTRDGGDTGDFGECYLMNVDTDGLTPNITNSNAFDSLISTYGFWAGWSSENLTIDGTDTTMNDYAYDLDVVNPTAGNQPDFTADDSDLNGNDSLEFVSADPNYLYKATNDFGDGKTEGMVWVAFHTPSSIGSFDFLFGACDESTNLSKFNVYMHNTGELRLLMNDGSANNGFELTTALSADTTYIFCFQSDGSTVAGYLNKTDSGFNTWTGLNTGNWLDFSNTASLLDNISIGGRINTSSLYSDSKIGLVGFTDIMTETNRDACFDALNDIFNAY